MTTQAGDVENEKPAGGVEKTQPPTPASDRGGGAAHIDDLVGRIDELMSRASRVPSGLEAVDYWVRRAESLFYFAIGIGLLYLISFVDSRNPAVTFLLAVVAVALVLYATGSQSMGVITSDKWRAVIGGGAAILAIIAGVLVSYFETSVRNVFRATATPYIIEAEFCLQLAHECAPEGGALVAGDPFFGKSKANVFAVGDAGDRPYAISTDGTGTIVRRHLVFARNAVALQTRQAERYHVYTRYITIKAIEDALKRENKCVTDDGNCTVRVIDGRRDGDVEMIYRLSVTFFNDKITPPKGGDNTLQITKTKDGGGTVDSSVTLF